MDQISQLDLNFQSVDHGSWESYDTVNSGLPDLTVIEIATASDGSQWFGTWEGAAHFDGTNWTVYNESNSGLPSNSVYAITTDPDGSLWFGTGGGAANFDGTNWTA